MGQAAAGLGVIMLVTLWAYAPALLGPFVYDDVVFVQQNDAIKDPRRLLEWLTDPQAATEGVRWGTIFRPLRTLSYGCDFGAWRLNAYGYRLTSLFVHFAAIAAVFALAFRWTRHVGGSLLGAAVFALHPLPAEAVLFVGARSDVLGVIPVIALALAALAPGPRTWWRTAGELGLLLIGLGCKEAAAAAVPAVALALWLRDGRPGAFWRAVRWSIPGVILVGVYAAARGAALGHTTRYDYLAGGDPFLTWASALRARVFELGQLLRPTHLAPSYLGVPVMDRWADAAFWLSLLATAGCGWVAWRCRRNAPAVTAGIGWWVLFLLPTSQLIPLNMLMGNRWLYTPLVGLACIVAAAAVFAQRRWGAMGGRILIAAGVAGVVSFAFQTHARAEIWSDDELLWRDAERSWPEDPMPYIALSGLYQQRAAALQFTDPEAAETAKVQGTDAVLRLAERYPHSNFIATAVTKLIAMERYEVARRLLQFSYDKIAEVRLRPSMRLELLLAQARFQTGDEAGAAELFARLLSPADTRVAIVDRFRKGEVFYGFRGSEGAPSSPSRALMWIQRAQLAWTKGDLDVADEYVRSALTEWPECQIALWARATTLRHAGSPDRAMALIDATWDGVEIQPLYDLRAELADIGGRPDIALNVRRQAVQRWPFLPELWVRVGRHYEARGEPEIARACFARSTDLAK